VNSASFGVQWFFNDSVLLIGETQDTLNPANSGNYSVTLTSLDGCSSSSVATTIQINSLPPVPVIFQNGGLLSTSTNGNLQWFFNGNSIFGATGNTYAYGDSGIYSVRVTDANGCTNQASIYIGQPSSSGEHKNASNWIILENPGQNGELKIKFDSNSENIYFLELMNLQGKVIFANEILKPNQGITQINTGLSEGFYFVKLSTAKYSLTQKWVLR
jgi:hypothetical protein